MSTFVMFDTPESALSATHLSMEVNGELVKYPHMTMYGQDAFPYFTNNELCWAVRRWVEVQPPPGVVTCVVRRGDRRVSGAAFVVECNAPKKYVTFVHPTIAEAVCPTMHERESVPPFLVPLFREASRALLTQDENRPDVLLLRSIRTFPRGPLSKALSPSAVSELALGARDSLSALGLIPPVSFATRVRTEALPEEQRLELLAVRATLLTALSEIAPESTIRQRRRDAAIAQYAKQALEDQAWSLDLPSSQTGSLTSTMRLE